MTDGDAILWLHVAGLSVLGESTQERREMVKSADLEINQDLQFQRRMWMAERVGWSAITILLIGAWLGLFGNGPMSRTTVQNEESFVVEYQRFGRYQAPMEMSVHLSVHRATENWLVFQLDRGFLSHIQIMQIMPSPAVTLPRPDGIRFLFPKSGQNGSILVTMTYQSEQVGMLKATVSADDTAPLYMKQFIYP